MSRTWFLITLRYQKNLKQDLTTHLVKVSTMVEINFKDCMRCIISICITKTEAREEDSSEIRDQERRINEIDVIFLGLEYKED